MGARTLRSRGLGETSGPRGVLTSVSCSSARSRSTPGGHRGPWAVPAAAAPTAFPAPTTSQAGLNRWRTDDMWHVRNGVDGALILTG